MFGSFKKGGGVRIGDGGWDPSWLVSHADHSRLAVRVLGAVEPRRAGARDADFERRGSGRGDVGCGHEGRAEAAGERRAGGGEDPLHDIVQAWVEEEEERVAGGGGGYGGVEGEAFEAYSDIVLEGEGAGCQEGKDG